LTLRIAHLSDIHFGGELREAAEAAVFAVADLAPTVTAVTGDLTLNGLPREFRAARDWLSRLPGPLVVTPGNHDTPYWNLPLRALTPFRRYRHHIGSAGGEAFDAPGLSLRLTEGASERLAGEGTIDQVLDDLAELRLLGADTVVLDPFNGDPDETLRPEDAWQALATVWARTRHLREQP